MVLLLAWETWCPTWGFLPVTWQTRAMECSGAKGTDYRATGALYQAIHYSRPRSANDMVRDPATMKWSSTWMSTSASAAFSDRVRISSAWLGSATPEGWLCAKITAAALCLSAHFTTSRG